MASMPTGGQTLPTSTLGLKDAWKKAQKKAKKKKNFRADEQHYTHTYASLHFAGVFALIRRLPGDVPPPLDHSGQNEA